jgi:hypothetical protein
MAKSLCLHVSSLLQEDECPRELEIALVEILAFFVKGID